MRGMTAELASEQLMSVDEYLAWEELQERRHEYVAGMVYAMAGGTVPHAAIAANVIVSLGGQLRGKHCRPYTSDLKVRIAYPTHTRFYYPDVTVACTMSPAQQVYHDQPTILVEVASDSTRRTDELEKRDAYQNIATLKVYVLLEQDRAAAVVWRRGSHGFGFEREVYAGLEAVIGLSEIDAQLPLAEVYEAVTFTPPAPAE
jgi:Uma2 family endonuclease